MRLAGRGAALAVCALVLGTGAALAQAAKPVPYWVSTNASEIMMRTGPGIAFPATWKYVRPELPLRVIQVRLDWRKVEDPEGNQGWMKASLLSEQRTGLVEDGPHPLRAAPDRAAKITWRVEPGVVGKLAKCTANWCEFDVRGRVGFIETAHMWGTDPGEAFD